MKIFVLTFLLAVFAGCQTDPAREAFLDENDALTMKDITQERDIKQYEQGGNFWCRRRFGGRFGNDPDRLEGEKKVRDFIWQQLIEKKRGYIKLSCPGTDVMNTSHYFIEPDREGKWKIVRRHIFRASDDKITRTGNILDLTERLENEEKNLVSGSQIRKRGFFRKTAERILNLFYES